MLHRTFVFVLLLNLAFCNSSRAEEPFTNVTAKAAQKAYETAIEKAKKEYLAQLEIAIKEAGAAGDLEEANRIAAERDSTSDAVDDPVERTRKRLEGSQWGPNRDLTVKRQPKHKVVYAAGHPGTWIVSDENTILLQSSRSANIEVWKFDNKLKSARVYTFKQFNKDKNRVYTEYR